MFLCHLCRYTFKNYQFVLALIFAIEEINRNPHLLSNISLGFDVYNVPYTEKNTLRSTLVWLTGQRNFMPNYNCRMNRKSAAVLTGTSWATSAQMGTLLQLYKFPQVREIVVWEQTSRYSLWTFQVCAVVKEKHLNYVLTMEGNR